MAKNTVDKRHGVIITADGGLWCIKDGAELFPIEAVTNQPPMGLDVVTHRCDQCGHIYIDRHCMIVADDRSTRTGQRYIYDRQAERWRLVLRVVKLTQ